MTDTNLNENVLSDDYPVHYNYLYVRDGEVMLSDISGTVADLKAYLMKMGIEVNEIKNFDIEGRKTMFKDEKK